MTNYAFTDPALPDHTVINSGNFSQLTPNTEIMKNTILTINGGNFCNVKKQPQWIVNGGNWMQISFCSHLHQKFIAHGLVECLEHCSHVFDTDDITIDNILVDTIYHYKDTIL